MNGKRKIPYGVMNWAEIVRECHFVDNTGYIRNLENCKTPVFLRPKRFGKTMVCSMLAHYYDVNRKRQFRELFGKTEIGRRPTPLRNSFLVLTFDFSTITVGTLAEIERNFAENVRRAVGTFAARYARLANWSKATEEADAASMIDSLRTIVRDKGLPPIYAIIDEYDNLTNQLVTANRDADYDAVCGHDGATNAVFDSFFKTFFKSFKAGLADGSVGRTYFTGVLPITLDDLSSGFNVGTPVQLRKDLLGLVGFTEGQVRTYVDEIFAAHGLDPALKQTVLDDLKRLYDGYRFLPNAAPLFNATICNWYLQCLVSDREIPITVTDSNVRTDVAWFRRLAQTNAKALGKVRKYVESGEGEVVSLDALSAKFGRVKFFTEEFYPYALYYLGLLTFENRFRLTVPNLTIKNMFVDYYDELSEFKNVDEARTAFIGAVEDLCLKDGTMGQKGATTGRHKEHKVKLTKNYYMSVFIVTMQQFVLILPVNGGFPSNFSLRPEGFLEEYSCFRCKLKSHNDALDTVLPAFSAFTGLAFDLPTNAQYEYACRAGTTGNYNNGTDSSYTELAWCRDDDNTEHDVGLKKPNAWGLYDCHGLQREICSDWYENVEPADPPAGVDYLEDPTGPDNAGGTLTQKCYRGGRYADGNDQLRSYVFGGFDPKAANGCLRPIVMCAGATAATTVTVSKAEAVCAPFATASGLKDGLDTRGPVSVESDPLSVNALPPGFLLFLR